MARKSLIVGSLLLHLGLGTAAFVTGVWKLDRLEGGTRFDGLAMMSPPAAAPEGGPSGDPQKLKPKEKKHVAKTLTQEPLVKAPETHDEPATTETGGGSGSATGPGTGIGPADSTGTCEGEHCAPTGDPEPKVEAKPILVPKPTATKIVPPQLLAALRTSGTTQIMPSDVTKTAMLHEGKSRVSGTLQVCITRDGTISSVTVRASTKYPDYDARLVAAARDWHYKPFTVDGTPQPVCAMTTFVYSIGS